jgi:putative heme-binding domain-containing protein
VRLAGQEDGQALDQILARMISDIEQQPGPAGETMLSAAIEALGRSRSPDSKATLRKLFDQHADRRDLLARAIAQTPRPDDFPYLIRSLQSGNATTTQICLQALGRLRRKATKPEEWRAAIIAGLRLGDAGGLAAASVLAEWTGEPHPGGKPIGEVMAHYQQVFARRFPNEPPAELPKDDASKNRYTLPQLVSFLESDRGRQGDVPRGSEVFHKANCAKCHKLGSVGTGVGPDLTTLRRRFQRSEIIEAILFPSAIISDQYKSLTVRTTDGLIHTGMPLQQPGTKNLVLLLPDATRIEIPPDKIDVREPAKISVMPEGALKDISLEELADLFAFLETTRFSTEPGTTTPAASPERK